MFPLKPNLDRILQSERAEVELKLYEYTNAIQHAEAMLAYYETRLATLNEQIVRRSNKTQEVVTTPILT